MSRSTLLARLHATAARLLLPRDFRQQYRDEIREAFADLDRRARRRGRLQRLLLLGRELRGMWRLRLGGSGHPAPGGEGSSRRGGRWLGELFEDVRFGIRILRKDPGWTATAVATLACGLAVFGGAWALIAGTLLAPLPYVDADELVQVWTLDRDAPDEPYTVTPADYLDMRRELEAIADVAAVNGFSTILASDEGAVRETGMRVSPHVFGLLGAPPTRGAVFDTEHATPGNDAVLVLSNDFWQSRLGGDPSVVGSELELDGVPHRILGVLGADFRFPDAYDPTEQPAFYRPLVLDEEDEVDRDSNYLVLLGRMADGATVAGANEELEVFSRRLAAAYPDSNRDRGFLAVGLREQYFGPLGPYLWMVQGAGGVVFLVVLANLAGLTLVRARHRRGELSLRAAIGARRGRLLRQIITEGMLLASLGGLVATGVLQALGPSLRMLAERLLPAMSRVDVDFRVLLVVVALAALAGLVTGFVGAREMLGGRARERLTGHAGLSTGRVVGGLRGSLVVGQVALSVALVIGAGLLTRSLLTLVSVPPGFDPEGVLLLEVIPPSEVYPDGPAIVAYYDALLRELGGMPRVEAAGLVSDTPFTSENRSLRFNLASRPVPEHEAPYTEYRTVSADYFRAMGIALLAGRSFTSGDDPDAPPVVVVNRAFAARHWSRPEEALGERLTLVVRDQTVTIVGLVDDVRDDGFAAEPEPMMYRFLEQYPARRMTVLLRGAGDPAALAAPARERLVALDPAVALGDVETLRSLLSRSVSDERFGAALAGSAALLASILAGLGIYGLMAYLVASRVREIGVRCALGASPRRVVRQVAGQSLLLTLIGTVLGLGAGLMASRLLRSVLFAVPPVDPVVYALAPVALLLVTLVATAIPARRASRVSPSIALRA